MDTVSLVWHPSPEANNSHASDSPVSVQGWFEMGSLLSSKLIQPKFMWRSTYQPDLDRKRLNTSSTTPHSVELLSIVRILKPTSIDRTTYPFAKLDQCFTLSNHSDTLYVFELSSTQERDWFVHGLKLVVARLASMIITGDDDVFNEFFSPWSHSAKLKMASTSTSTEDESMNTDKEESMLGSAFQSTTDNERGDLWGQVCRDH